MYNVKIPESIGRLLTSAGKIFLLFLSRLNNIAISTPSFEGVIPGGQSFSIPVDSSNLTTVTNLGTGFSWQPNLRSGTTLILVAGDDRGNGTGGSILNVVSAGTNQDGSCLSNTSPSSTPGNPAGGSYPTGGGGYVFWFYSHAIGVS